jgi:diadenosine tetraphosphatase ApaH/serine/threonine PP2A family protein phosphatase
MRTLILSDIHSNLAALEAVLARASALGGWDRAWVLGDSVGYGPQPDECLDRIFGFESSAIIAGNHDLAAAGRTSTAPFNPLAAQAIEWTRRRLSRSHRQRLGDLPLTAAETGVTLVHGSPRDPVWEYMTSAIEAGMNLGHFSTQGCAFGHTHIQAWYTASGAAVAGGPARDGDAFIAGARRFLLNPGSVGQPRDGDPRAGFALFDTAKAGVSFHRVEYDVAATQRLMAAAGLPEPLISRLSVTITGRARRQPGSA